jgi:lipopolysaccharide/colanic/teichoic acid biosynthesis glycosyltransferase
MDLYYIDNWTLWMDLKLIAHTVRVVLQGTGM